MPTPNPLLVESSSPQIPTQSAPVQTNLTPPPSPETLTNPYPNVTSNPSPNPTPPRGWGGQFLAHVFGALGKMADSFKAGAPSMGKRVLQGLPTAFAGIQPNQTKYGVTNPIGATLGATSRNIQQQRQVQEENRQKQEQIGIEEKNLALTQARDAAEIAHYTSMDNLERAKFLQTSMADFDMYKASGATPYEIGGVPVPEFANTDAGRNQMEKYVTDNKSMLNDRRLRYAIDPATGNFALFRMPDDLHYQMSNGTTLDIPVDSPHFGDLLRYAEDDQNNQVRLKALQFQNMKFSESLSVQKERLALDQKNNDLRGIQTDYRIAAETDNQYRGVWQKTQSEMDAITKAMQSTNPARAIAALALPDVPDLDAAKGRLKVLQEQSVSQRDDYLQFHQEVYEPAETASTKVAGINTPPKPKPSTPQGRPVYQNGKVIGYTTDGKTMIPVQ